MVFHRARQRGGMWKHLVSGDYPSPSDHEQPPANRAASPSLPNIHRISDRFHGLAHRANGPRLPLQPRTFRSRAVTKSRTAGSSSVPAPPPSPRPPAAVEFAGPVQSLGVRVQRSALAPSGGHRHTNAIQRGQLLGLAKSRRPSQSVRSGRDTRCRVYERFGAQELNELLLRF